jgi:hypothetical protein
MGQQHSVDNGRWRENWLAVSPPGGVLVHLGRSRNERRASCRAVAALPAGTPVVMACSAPRAIRRCRSFASAAGIVLEREYLALPSADAPGYLVEDTPSSFGAFLESVLFAPPGVPFQRAVEIALRVMRTARPWRVARAAAPARVVVGRRG